MVWLPKSEPKNLSVDEIGDFCGASWFFIHIAPYYFTYLLNDQFLVDNYLWQFYEI